MIYIKLVPNTHQFKSLGVIFVPVYKRHCYENHFPRLGKLQRKDGASRHHCRQIRAPMKFLAHHSTVVLRWLKGSLNWAPIILRASCLLRQPMYVFPAWVVGQYYVLTHYYIGNYFCYHYWDSYTNSLSID